MDSLKVVVPYAKKVLFYALSLFMAGALLAGKVSAQGESSLWGSITDVTNAGVPGVTVLIRNLETGTERSLLTDESGNFNASALPVGHYEITASKKDFQTAYRSSVSLAVGQRAEVDFQLRVGEVRQTVEVPVVSTALEITTEDTSGLVGECEVTTRNPGPPRHRA